MVKFVRGVLLEKDNKVVCLDNFATGKIKNIKEFLENPNFVLIGEILESLELFKSYKDVDYVLHQAALDRFQDPLKTLLRLMMLM